VTAHEPDAPVSADLAAGRLLAAGLLDPAGGPLDPAGGPAGEDDVASGDVRGEPQVITVPVAELGGLEVGTWAIGTGIARDVEVDEIFLVLAGIGRVTFADGSSIELHPGVLVRLHAGDETSWEIRSPLRKLYLAQTSPR
jgi:uncharacterized cupin superfamily protein